MLCYSHIMKLFNVFSITFSCILLQMHFFEASANPVPHYTEDGDATIIQSRSVSVRKREQQEEEPAIRERSVSVRKREQEEEKEEEEGEKRLVKRAKQEAQGIRKHLAKRTTKKAKRDIPTPSGAPLFTGSTQFYLISLLILASNGMY